MRKIRNTRPEPAVSDTFICENSENVRVIAITGESRVHSVRGLTNPYLNSRVRARPCTITAPRFLPPSLRRYFFKLNAGIWRRAEAPCMRGSDELEDSRELGDSEGACWLEVDRWMGGVGKGIDLKEVGLNAVRRMCAQMRVFPCTLGKYRCFAWARVSWKCDLGTFADVREDDLVIDVGENEVGPTTGRDAGSGTCKDDVDDRNINEGGVDDERADLWGREVNLPDFRLARSLGWKQGVQGRKQDFEDVGDGYGLVCRP
ncbi:hypothetical protein B0H13DRAFT_1900590 [Mycena leptocephala]|nr:hypothetical protein B0H13DRAFT_1900590 [Mycena leptocephala]